MRKCPSGKVSWWDIVGWDIVGWESVSESLLVCALLTNSIHSNRLTEQPFVLFNLLFCCLIITVETHQKYHRGILK